MKYFLDTYAIIEIIQGNPKYKKFSYTENITLNQNLAELCYGFLKENDEESMIKYFEKYSKISVSLPQNTIVKAMKFKRKCKNKKFSYIDCMGYIYSKLNNFIFVTGDKEFKDIEGVEFIK
jgi:predicted nucleic acid-binding protein